MSERSVVIGGAVVMALVVAIAIGLQVLRPTHRPAPAPSGGAGAADGPRVQTISTGERVDLLARLPDVGRTVVEFTAEW